MGKFRKLMVVSMLAAIVIGLLAAPAQARHRDRPRLDATSAGTRTLVFTGHARPHARVRLQVRTSLRWTTIRRARASARGTFRMATRPTTVSQRFRVVSRGRVSEVRLVRARAQRALSRVRVPADACGVRPAKPGGGYYACTFREDFGGTHLDRTRWAGHQYLGQGDRCVLDNADTVAVSGGALRLSVVPAVGEDACPLRADGTRGTYASGWVSTFGAWSQQYGRFEARMKVQATDLPGLHEGFWLWPDQRYGSDADWPNTGEIDIAETYSEKPDLVVPFLHYSDDAKGPVDGLNTAWDCKGSRGEWHDYALEWTAERLEIFVDGKSCLVNTAGAPTFRKRFIIAFTQVLGGGTNDYDGRVPLPATMQVDWVKAWR